MNTWQPASVDPSPTREGKWIPSPPGEHEPGLIAHQRAPAQQVTDRYDASFWELPRANHLHAPLGPDPVAAFVIMTLCALVLMSGAITVLLINAVVH